MATASETKQLLNNIARLGGQQANEEDIEYVGTKVIIPEKFKEGGLRSYRRFLEEYEKQQEQVVEFKHQFNYRPWDGAYNAYNAFKKAFGFVQGKVIPGSFFSPEQPPQYIQFPVSLTETAEVPWGWFGVPLLENTTFMFGAGFHSDYGQVFQMVIKGPRKFKAHAAGIFKMVAEELAANSIYLGKAIDGQGQPQFIDLSGVDSNKVVYSGGVEAQLKADLWAYIELDQETKDAIGMPSKRAVLLEGTYGTGKTLTANVTAKMAIEAGMTFINARAGRDDFFEVMQTARLYQGDKGAIVFLEDADTLPNASGEADDLSRLLDVFDGIQSKHTKIMVVMTTNHPDRLTEGMRRPGRIDRNIKIGLFDKAAVEKLTRIIVGDMLASNIDFDAVAESMEGYPPAFIKEALDSSKRYAVVRNGSVNGIEITTDDIVHSAEGLRDQFSWMKGNVDKDDVTIGQLLQKDVKKAIAAVATPAEAAYAQVWDVEELANYQNGSKSHS